MRQAVALTLTIVLYVLLPEAEIGYSNHFSRMCAQKAKKTDGDEVGLQ
jgi:hypothetical protein